MRFDFEARMDSGTVNVDFEKFWEN